MTIAQELDEILAEPHETVRCDFKESIGWERSLRVRLEIVRDMTCLANRSGGMLVFGVANDGNVVGLQEGDNPPDPTVVGALIRRYFDPPVRFDVLDTDYDGRHVWVIKVDEFDRVPIVASRIGNDENNVAVFREGDIVRRTDAMECARISSATAMFELVESAVNKTGAVVANMLPREVLTADEPHAARIETDETIRFCDISPVGLAQKVDTLAILDLISESGVRSRGGGIHVPRSIDPRTLEPSAVVRESHRVLIELTRDQGYGRATSVIEVSSDLRVRMREGLWERDGTVDFTSMFTYTLACLRFAQKFYAVANPASVDIRIGLAGSLGRRLDDDPRAFSGFHQTYVSTSEPDLVASRSLSMAELGSSADRLAVGRSINIELAGYFGFRLNDDAYDAHLNVALTNIPELNH